ncbi:MULTISPECIES: ABC transporter ATP-binding protein [Clostridiaceae]|uniref:ABC transporter transmembrane domain-containing protein n=1 Tax=Clostridiaceae TaxID=31979 RepID=UPI0005505DDD|nr:MULTISPECIES: ABC transporter ATP-binding protein [Clostridiaceae]
MEKNVYFNYLNKYKIRILIMMVLCILLTVTSLLKPYIISNFFDLLTNNLRDTKKVVNNIYLLILIWMNQIITGYFFNMEKIKLDSKFMFNILSNVIEHLKVIPYSEYIKLDSGYLCDRLVSDASEISNFIIENIFEVTINILSITISYFMIFKIYFLFGLILLPMFLIYSMLYIFFKEKIYLSNYTYTDEHSKFFSKLIRELKNIKSIKINSWHKESKNELYNAFVLLFNKGVNFSKISYMYSNVQNVVTFSSNIVILLYGVSLVEKNIITIGKLIVFNSFFNVIISGINYFLSLSQQYQQYLASKNRIDKLLLIKEEIIGNVTLKEVEDLQIRNLSFYYEKENQIIKNLNYKFKKGKIYCICGKNGSGKSTLFDLLLGLYDNYSGEIYINSTNLKYINLYNFRKENVSICQQEPDVFSYTINKNKKNSYFNCIFNNYKNLSGGEKQKSALNMCLNKKFDILLLDEPSSALDKDSVKKLKQILKKLKKNSIIIVITHDRELIENADYIINIGDVINK